MGLAARPLKGLFRSTSVYLSGEIGAQGLNVLKYKVLALRLGPEGIGLFSLVDSFFQLLIVGSSNGVANGSVQLIGSTTATSRDPAEVRRESGRIAAAGLTLVGLIAGMLMLVLWFAGPLVVSVFLDPTARPYFPIYLLAFPLLCFVPLLNALLQAQLRIREMALARLLGAAADALVIAGLVLLFALKGWFIGLVLSASASLLILVAILVRLRAYEFRRFSIGQQSVRRLLVFFFQISIVLTAVGVGSTYILRRLTLDHLGIGAVGLYQSALSFMGYLGLVSRASAVYFFPSIARAETDAQRRDELSGWTTLNLAPVIFGAIVLVLFGDLAVRAFFSGRFDGLQPELSWFMLAEVFVVVTMGYQHMAVALPIMRTHILLCLAIHIGGLVIAVLLMPALGFRALGVASCAGSAIGLATYHAALRRRIGHRFRGSTLLLLGIAIVAVPVAGRLAVETVLLRVAFLSVVTFAIYRAIDAETRQRVALKWRDVRKLVTAAGRRGLRGGR